MAVCTAKELDAEWKRLNELLAKDTRTPTVTKEVASKALAAYRVKAFEDRPLLARQVLENLPDPKLETTYEERRSIMGHKFYGSTVRTYGTRYTSPIVLPEKYL
jgi:hypothetical protein